MVPGVPSLLSALGKTLVRNQKVAFTRGCFRKGVRVPKEFFVGDGCGIGFKWVVVGCDLPVENAGFKGKRGGEGGGDRQRNRQVNARAFVKTTL